MAPLVGVVPLVSLEIVFVVMAATVRTGRLGA
jgi:hypothetical protein